MSWISSGLSKVGHAVAPVLKAASPLASFIPGMGVVSKIGDFLGNHGDQILGAGAIGEGYLNSRRSSDLRNQAIGLSNQSYSDRAPLRSAGVSGMLNDTPPDLSSVFASGNPYSKIKPRGR